MSQPICTVMVGLPAMGKSTRVAALAAINPDVFVYSTDAILERTAQQLGKTYDDVFEKHIKSATAEADIDLAEAIKNRLDIVWDQTNLSIKKRTKIINRMKNSNYQVECECILLPAGDSQWEDWQWRMRSRPGKTILYNMMDNFGKPTVDEGFERVIFFNMYGALIAIDYGDTK